MNSWFQDYDRVSAFVRFEKVNYARFNPLQEETESFFICNYAFKQTVE